MSNPKTQLVNANNINSIRSQINKKNSSRVFLPTIYDSGKVITDHDHFPYSRYFQGVPTSYEPIVDEREAGFRKVNNSCYQLNPKPPFDDNPFPYNYPNHCFQTACSTVYPCYPELVDIYSKRGEFDLILNRNCVIQYR
jgi:hypothetical protein